MKISVPIPETLSHLKLDERGYPIPYFVPYVNGKPEFRMLDQQKQLKCIADKLCSICGKKLAKGLVYFITGPVGLENRTASDPGMHRSCAEFSLAVCPHLFMEKTIRRETGIEQHIHENSPIIREKPKHFFLIKCKKYKPFQNPFHKGTLIKFYPISSEKYAYENGTLIKK